MNDKQVHIWNTLVENFTKNKCIMRDEYSNDFMKVADHLSGTEDLPFSYVVYFNEQISMKEAEAIVYIWNKIYPADFEIDSSIEFDPNSDDDVEMDDSLFEEVVQHLNKFLHNRWVEDMTQEGWRFGMRKNIDEKTDPRLRDWESLNEDYKTYIEITKEQATEFFKKYHYIFV